MSEVISINKKKQDEADKVPKTKEELDSAAYFAEMEAKNKAKAEKIRKEKLAANKSVLRSYRIKP